MLELVKRSRFGAALVATVAAAGLAFSAQAASPDIPPASARMLGSLCHVYGYYVPGVGYVRWEVCH